MIESIITLLKCLHQETYYFISSYNYNFITISESETREFVSFKHGIIHKVLNILVDMYQLKIHINVEIQ